ncbi:MAG: amidohydrolase family protein [Alphaproteobacteria bacterium]|nr:amidohydrolase family protein [Alphaproteobacteria bacterium]
MLKKFDEKIIDTHAHIGSWCADNVDFTEDAILDAVGKPIKVEVGDNMETDYVEYIMVSNMSGIDLKPDDSPKIDEITANTEMLDICKRNPQMKALIVGQPGYGKARYLDEMIEKRGSEIYGIKLHPNTLHLNANDPRYEPYMNVARKHNLPVLFHSQDNYSDPFYIYETAKKFPTVPTIMAHLGMGSDDNHWYAFGILQTALRSKTANLYADISWLSPGMINAIIYRGEEYTVKHLLFGTDIPLGPYGDPSFYPNRVSEVKSAIIEEFGKKSGKEIIQRIFYQNAYDLFFKNHK